MTMFIFGRLSWLRRCQEMTEGLSVGMPWVPVALFRAADSCLMTRRPTSRSRRFGRMVFDVT